MPVPFRLVDVDEMEAALATKVPIGDFQSLSWHGGSALNTEEQNRDALKALLLTSRFVIVPANVPWSGLFEASSDIPAGTMIIDAYNDAIIMGKQRIAYPDNGAASFITIQPAIEGSADCGFYAMPAGPEITALGGAPPRPAGAFKAFQDNYAHAAANPDPWGNVSYRDGGLVAYVLEGIQGMGSVHFNGKSNGRFIPFCPESYFSLMGSSNIPMRLYRLQPLRARAGTYFSSHAYFFDPAMPFHKEGKTVVQGQLVNECGKIYEAQNTGVTGPNGPIHATYRKKRLNLTGVVGTFVVGEVVKQDPGTAGTGNGILEVIEGSGDYLFQRWNQINFTVGGTVTGVTSGATGTIGSITDVDVRIDNNDNNYQPPGPAITGLIESDGVIDWMFLDNIIGYISGNLGMQGIVILGDDPDVLPYPGHATVGIHVVKDMMFYLGKAIRFLNVDGTLSNMLIERDTTNKMRIRAGSPSNAEIHLHGGNNASGSLRVIEKAVIPTNIRLAYTQVTKASGAATVDISGANGVLFNDLVATNFTGFTGMSTGQPIDCRFATGLTTLIHDPTKLSLPGGAPFTPAADTTYRFYAHSGSVVGMSQ